MLQVRVLQGAPFFYVYLKINLFFIGYYQFNNLNLKYLGLSRLFRASRGALLKKMQFLSSLKTIAMPFSAKGNPTQALRKAYLTAFALIAVLTLLSHFLTSFITAKQQESTEVSFLISRQSNLVQQIIIDGYAYVNESSAIDQGFFKQTIKELSASHYHVVQSVEGRGEFSASKSLHDVYFEQPFMLNEKLTDFIKTAEAVASYPPDEMQSSKVSVMGNLTEKRARLLPLIDAAVQRYQDETSKVISRNYFLQMASVVLIIIVLVFEALFIFRPLTSRIDSYYKLLIKQAMEDPLTGLNNRRAFGKQADREISQARRNDKHICVGLCDLDHFKSVNDVYGHEVGDRVLKHFSALLKETLRGGDIIGRIGGEEFAIVLAKDTGADTGQKVLERLVEKVANTPCPYVDENGEEQELVYTTSLGFCSLIPDENSDVHELLKIADEALYEAKETGRNRVVYADLHAPSDKRADDNGSTDDNNNEDDDEAKKGPETLISGQTAVIEGV
jgi:diguanylate cyclase (GGDEF)-like protein